MTTPTPDPCTGLPDRDALRSRSGLDLMQAALRGEFSGPPIGDAMGFRLTGVAAGEVSFEGTPVPQMANVFGTVHGGWYGAILDSALGCAVMTALPQGSVYTTLEYKVNITRAIPMGMAVRATAWVQHAGRSTGVANGEVRGIGDGRLYATGTTTCIIMTAG